MSDVNAQGLREMAESVEAVRRIVLIGKTGVGKSATGNTILGRNNFKSKSSAASVTEGCDKSKGEVGGRKVAVIDTPGLFDTNLEEEEVIQKVKECISLSAPGPHAFLVVIQIGRFTEEERETVRLIQNTFGEESAKYTMVLFTRGDDLEGETIQEFVSTCKELKEIISKCNGRYHVFNNKEKDPSQVSQLLDKIDRMVVDNGGSYYTNEILKKVEEVIEEEKARLLEEAEEQKQKDLEKLKAKYEGEALEKAQRLLEQRYEHEARAKAEECNYFRDAANGARIGGSMLGPLGAGVGAAVGSMVGLTKDACTVQ